MMKRAGVIVLLLNVMMCLSLFGSGISSLGSPRQALAQPAEFPFDDFNRRQRGAEEPSAAQVIIVLFVYAVLLAVSLGVLIFVLWLLSGFLKALPPQFRLMEPGMVWLMLIPFFNLVWMFFVYVRIAKSYQNYFRAQGRTDVGDCGEMLGLWYCICVCLSFIPCVNMFSGIASLVLMILYLVKLNGLKHQVQAGFVQPKWGLT
jgi:hypothetical protein